MDWNLPNKLTVGRVFLAAIFFILLGLYEPDTYGGRWLLNIAFVVFIIAGITDVLDGYIARKYNQTSVFGRMTDPIVDKVLVVGAFVMLTGSNFAFQGDPDSFEASLPGWLSGGMLSSVQAWMVVVVLAREFIVSGIRGYSESQGLQFPATSAGKIKMLIQSVAICTVLYQMANFNGPARQVPPVWTVVTKIVVIWAALIATVLSGLVYMSKARKLLAGDGHGKNDEDSKND